MPRVASGTWTPEYLAKYKRQWIQDRPEKRRAYNVAAWKRRMALPIEERYAYQRRWKKANPGKLRDIERTWRMALRDEMQRAYGGRCECCGETEPEFLSLDHRFGDGQADRKRSKRHTKMLMDLKRSGWPKDRYRLLCMNCNHALGRMNNPDGLCPHERRWRAVMTYVN